MDFDVKGLSKEAFFGDYPVQETGKAPKDLLKDPFQIIKNRSIEEKIKTLEDEGVSTVSEIEEDSKKVEADEIRDFRRIRIKERWQHRQLFFSEWERIKDENPELASKSNFEQFGSMVDSLKDFYRKLEPGKPCSSKDKPTEELTEKPSEKPPEKPAEKLSGQIGYSSNLNIKDKTSEKPSEEPVKNDRKDDKPPADKGDKKDDKVEPKKDDQVKDVKEDPRKKEAERMLEERKLKQDEEKQRQQEKVIGITNQIKEFSAKIESLEKEVTGLESNLQNLIDENQDNPDFDPEPYRMEIEKKKAEIEALKFQVFIKKSEIEFIKQKQVDQDSLKLDSLDYTIAKEEQKKEKMGDLQDKSRETVAKNLEYIDSYPDDERKADTVSDFTREGVDLGSAVTLSRLQDAIKEKKRAR